MGTGYAAFCAAIEAYDASGRRGDQPDILIIDKQPANAMGGNSILCAGSAQFAGTHHRERRGQHGGRSIRRPPQRHRHDVAGLAAWGDYRANQDVLEAVTAPAARHQCSGCEKPGSHVQPRRPASSPACGTTTTRPSVRSGTSPARIRRSRAATTDPSWYYPAAAASPTGTRCTTTSRRAASRPAPFGTNNILTEHKAARFIQAGADGPVVGIEVQD